MKFILLLFMLFLMGCTVRNSKQTAIQKLQKQRLEFLKYGMSTMSEAIEFRDEHVYQEHMSQLFQHFSDLKYVELKSDGFTAMSGSKRDDLEYWGSIPVLSREGTTIGDLKAYGEKVRF